MSIDNVCEWFEQYVDIVADIVVLRFSDGTVKRAKRGLYMRDIEKSIRKMMIDQIANEKKTGRWTPDESWSWLWKCEKCGKTFHRDDAKSINYVQNVDVKLLV